MERSIETALLQYEQEEIYKTLGCCNTTEVDDDTMGLVAVLD